MFFSKRKKVSKSHFFIKNDDFSLFIEKKCIYSGTCHFLNSPLKTYVSLFLWKSIDFWIFDSSDQKKSNKSGFLDFLIKKRGFLTFSQKLCFFPDNISVGKDCHFPPSKKVQKVGFFGPFLENTRVQRLSLIF